MTIEIQVTKTKWFRLGGFRGHDEPVASTNLSTQRQDNETTDRCYLYQKEFMKCLDAANGDSSKCQGFWDALKVCWMKQLKNAHLEMCFFFFLGMSTATRNVRQDNVNIFSFSLVEFLCSFFLIFVNLIVLERRVRC